MAISDLPSLESFVYNLVDTVTSRTAIAEAFVYIGLAFMTLLLITLLLNLANNASVTTIFSERSFGSRALQQLHPLMTHLAARVEAALEKYDHPQPDLGGHPHVE
ncbi:uncharacterized protein LOC122249117 isoform X1 [Penaeus japonicus]|uniref:uncharacterized protein LOC122249117 isoform X1 n=1 Tax=Penaeus japonicus TaxID=27405 RepID=UPI001C7175D9|nr:uncharacterized protein LOC122249117 isoform X1 [Penaeus japonicus]